MRTFIDSSAILAIINPDDRWHRGAAALWSEAVGRREAILTTNYILLETSAVVQRRHGLALVQTIVDRLRPVVRVVWITEEIHDAALRTVLAAGRRDLSLVDCTSFEIMRRLGIRRCFTFDPYFRDQGFEVIP